MSNPTPTATTSSKRPWTYKGQVIDELPTPYFTYCVTHEESGTPYYGKCSAKDWKQYMGSGVELARMRKRFGDGAFTREIVAFYPDAWEMDFGERVLHEQYVFGHIDETFNLDDRSFSLEIESQKYQHYVHPNTDPEHVKALKEWDDGLPLRKLKRSWTSSWNKAQYYWNMTVSWDENHPLRQPTKPITEWVWW